MSSKSKAPLWVRTKLGLMMLGDTLRSPSLLLYLCLLISTHMVVIWKLTLSGGTANAATSDITDAATAFNHEESAVRAVLGVTTSNATEDTTTTHSKSEIINTIALLGERNSGTTWMLKELQRCYQEKFMVLNHLTRHKHDFQYDDGKQHNRTLVVAEFRDPYQYVLAMVDKPRRALAHRQMDWYTFVTTPWTTKRAPSDLKYAHGNGRDCRANFKFNEVVPCEKNPAPNEYLTEKPLRFQENPEHRKPIQDIPMYELRRDGSGLPYPSIVDMRADKIRNHVLEVRDYPFVEDVLIVRYEELLHQGTASLLKQITEITGTKPHCDATPPQPDRPQRQVPDDFKQWMNEHVDWEAEALIGYKKY